MKQKHWLQFFLCLFRHGLKSFKILRNYGQAWDSSSEFWHDVTYVSWRTKVNSVEGFDIRHFIPEIDKIKHRVLLVYSLPIEVNYLGGSGGMIKLVVFHVNVILNSYYKHFWGWYFMQFIDLNGDVLFFNLNLLVPMIVTLGQGPGVTTVVCSYIMWHLSFHEFDIKYFKNEKWKVNSFDMYSLFRVQNHCLTSFKSMLKYISQNFDADMCRGFQIWQHGVM